MMVSTFMSVTKVMDIENKTYSPCKTIESSTSTFLFKTLDRIAVRGRFVDTSGAGGVGFIFKTEDLLPTKATRYLFQSESYSNRS